ncbi:glucose-1-phosphate thymidylyltransferase [Elysia marginata]|uniref:Glucose-1-phosphate thymidylyltransferase n=1 Tax=Elysia marginata TaxID=1093978 RepID=A0AAV4FMP7_9GAST|nr:glucose-1-phosphate thymidylyltransferase [Elysia marginata]
MGAKIYGGTSIGDGCKVGGEVNNAVIFSNSNKGHEGFLGNSVIGEWCNIGADSNTSNMKNNYGNINVWSYANEGYVDTGLQFCGLIMGDHSKCGINTMFNTGSVVGVSSAIFGGGFVPKFVPSFVWGDMAGHFTEYVFDKAIETSERMMARRNRKLHTTDSSVLKHIFEISDTYRKKLNPTRH